MINKEKLSDAMDGIDEKYIAQLTERLAHNKKRQNTTVFKLAGAAACIACVSFVLLWAGTALHSVISTSDDGHGVYYYESSDHDKGEPTIFIAPDGMPIYDSEVTRVLYSDKEAAELTADDDNAIIQCDGFQYFKEPGGEAYDSYHDPELFDGGDFKEKMPENNAPYRRLNVGDSICGLTLKKALTVFENHGREQFEQLGTYYTLYMADKDFPDYPNRNFAEFEGSITLEGFLGIDPDGYISFTPTENKLPVMPNGPYYKTQSTYTVANLFDTELYSVGETSEISLTLSNGANIGGIKAGDAAYAQVVISDIAYYMQGEITAKLDNAKVLSDVLWHTE